MKILEIISGIYGKIHLDEVSMRPTDLQKWVSSAETEGMLMGIEFELYCPFEDFTQDKVPDFSYDLPVTDIDDIIQFFGKDILDTLNEQYQKWKKTAVSNYIKKYWSEYDIQDKMWKFYDKNDFIEAARKQLDPEYSDVGLEDEDVSDKVDEIIDSKIINSFRDKDEYYRAARKEYVDEANEEAEKEFRESDWLSDVGIGSLKEAYQIFDLKWPYYKNPEYISKELVAEVFKSDLGLPVTAEIRSDDNDKRWNVEYDGSLSRPKERYDSGIEIVSPPLPISQMLSEMDRFIKWAKSKNCYTNETTGLHMNISVPNLSSENLDYVKLALFMGDQYVLQQFQREANNYCASAIDIIKSNPSYGSIQKVLNRMRQHLNTATSKIIHSGETDKYTSINTHDNRVEFRGPGGDWLNQDIKKLSLTSIRLAMALKIACDENAYKQEYAKKLYKLLSEVVDDKLFAELMSQYSSGQITKEQLISQLKNKWGSAAPSKYVLKDPKSAFDYARDFEHGRFPAGETIIAKDPHYSLAYAQLTGKRFPAGEPEFAKDPHYSLAYAKIIKERFPAGEPEIAKDVDVALTYAQVIKERFPLGEPIIAKSTWHSVHYAKIIGRFPAGESEIAKNIDASTEYASIIGDPHPETWRERYLKGEIK